MNKQLFNDEVLMELLKNVGGKFKIKDCHITINECPEVESPMGFKILAKIFGFQPTFTAGNNFKKYSAIDIMMVRNNGAYILYFENVWPYQLKDMFGEKNAGGIIDGIRTREAAKSEKLKLEIEAAKKFIAENEGGEQS